MLIGDLVYFNNNEIGKLIKVGEYYIDLDYKGQVLTLLRSKVSLKNEFDSMVIECCGKLNAKINEIWNPMFEAFGCEKPICTPVNDKLVSIK